MSSPSTSKKEHGETSESHAKKSKVESPTVVTHSTSSGTLNVLI